MYKIGEFSKLVSIPVKTLRYYDEIDLFVPSSIEPFTGYRYYSFEQIFDAKMILKLKDLGLSLGEIKEFLKTNDMDILFNKQNEYKEKINSIKEYINNKYNNYKVVIGSYDDYILYNGLKASATPYGISVKEGNTKYFLIKCNDEFIDDFGIGIDNNNWFKISDKYISKEYLDFIINGLKGYGFTFGMFIVPIEKKEKISFIKSYFKDNVSENCFQGKWEYLKIKVSF